MRELIDALRATGYPFAHFGWSKAPEGDYGVYAEDGDNFLAAGNRHAERVTRLTVDLFTRAVDVPQVYATPSGAYDTDGDGLYSWVASIPGKMSIEAAFERVPCAWYLNSVQFEDDTGYVHLEWVVEALGEN